MIIGFLPPSNWKGANLVTHELHIRKKKHPTLEMKLLLSCEHLISLFQQEGRPGLHSSEQSPVILATLLE